MNQVQGLKTGLFRDKEFLKSFYGDTQDPWKISGLASGEGWNDNVCRAVWMLTRIERWRNVFG